MYTTQPLSYSEAEALGAAMADERGAARVVVTTCRRLGVQRSTVAQLVVDLATAALLDAWPPGAK